MSPFYLCAIIIVFDTSSVAFCINEDLMLLTVMLDFVVLWT